MNPDYLFWQQYQLIFAPAPPLILLPDLRIHARRDPVIRVTDELFHTVPGDHVPHRVHPTAVAAAINAFVAQSPALR